MKKKFFDSKFCVVAFLVLALLVIGETRSYSLTVTVNNNGSEKMFICFIYLDGNSMTAQGWWGVDAGKGPSKLATR